MYKVHEIKKDIPQDPPTHWSIYKDDNYDAAVTVWTNKAMADQVCEFLNKNSN